jgi:hypothetical protein
MKDKTVMVVSAIIKLGALVSPVGGGVFPSAMMVSLCCDTKD